MVDVGQIGSQENEIILSVKYSAWRVWLVAPACMLFIYLFFSAVLPLAEKGSYIKVVILVAAGLVMLLLTLDQVLTKRILFLEDRVTKGWHFFGQRTRTIPYSRAKVISPLTFFGWSVGKGYQIKEIHADGKSSLVQIPIQYNGLMVPPDIRAKVGVIVDYLTEDKGYHPRIFKKSTLSKEALSAKGQT